jgi:hypothetical protein
MMTPKEEAEEMQGLSFALGAVITSSPLNPEMVLKVLCIIAGTIIQEAYPDPDVVVDQMSMIMREVIAGKYHK